VVSARPAPEWRDIVAVAASLTRYADRDFIMLSLTDFLAPGRLKTRDWKTRHQTAGVENAGVEQYGKPKSPLFNIVTSVLQQPLD